ncbi:MAG: YihY/virulence factor BrkB family protein [Lachnospiraceae bacterium]|nr:YihY/virulence factor BrkB family protein [Lachnospiraceae bacterium]
MSKKKAKKFFEGYMEISMLYRQTNARLFASSIAFFVFLAIFPTVLLVFSIVPFTPLEQADILKFMAKVLPDALDNLTVNIIRQLYGNSPAIFSITTVVLLWSSAKGIQGIKSGLNVINGCAELSNFIMLRLRAIVYSLIFAVAIVIMVAVVVFTNYIYDLLQQYFGFHFGWIEAMINLRFLVQWIVYAVLLMFVYAWVPDKKTRPGRQWKGALFTGTTWTMFNWAFNYYLQHFSSFNLYGSMATVVIMLIWVYSLSVLFMYGGIINVYFNKRKEELTAKKSHSKESQV